MSNNITKGKLSTENHPGPVWPFSPGASVKSCSHSSSTCSVMDFARTVGFLTIQRVQIWSCTYCFRVSMTDPNLETLYWAWCLSYGKGAETCLLLIAAHTGTSQVQSEMLLPTQHCCRLHLPAAFYIIIIHSPSFLSVVNDGQQRTMHKGLECGF